MDRLYRKDTENTNGKQGRFYSFRLKKTPFGDIIIKKQTYGVILMNYKPNPLLYGANEDFFSSFLLSAEMNFTVEQKILSKAVSEAMERYPYFSVRPVRCENSIILEQNENPVPVFPDDRKVTLGTEESLGHLLYFGSMENKIFLNASHYIADGTGILPLLKTVLYLYVSSVSGGEGIEKGGIRLPGESVPKEEYIFPFPDSVIESEAPVMKKAPEKAYPLDETAFDNSGLYAYHLRIPAGEMMKKAHPSDGSPVSFLSVMLYRALLRLDPDMALPVVGHVQHQYRASIGTPLCHHSLVSYIPVVLKSSSGNWSIEKQNTAIRGQVILGCEKESDIAAVNRIVSAFPGDDSDYSERKRAMAEFSAKSTDGKTFGISYVGKIDWSGLDRYVKDLHAYIGEKKTRNMLLIEVMAVGENFSLTFMQSGKGTRYLDAFSEELRSCGIPIKLIGEGRYSLCDTRIPE